MHLIAHLPSYIQRVRVEQLLIRCWEILSYRHIKLGLSGS